MNRIFLLTETKEDVIVTGGHVYNKSFYSFLSIYSNYSLIFRDNSLQKQYFSWKRLFAPLCELKFLKLISKGDIVFWGDTTYKYHFLLLLILKLFYRKVRLCIIIHHFPFLSWDDTKCFYKTKIYFLKKYYKLINDIIVPSPYTQKKALDLLPQNNIVYIPLPFEQIYNPSQQYEQGNLLYVGTIEERKGLIYLIEALNLLNKQNVYFLLDIVGKIQDESYYNFLQEKIKRYNLTNKIFFRGRVSSSELDYYYSKAESFVFPSLFEGYGMVLVEAMQRGLPIVAFDNTAMPYSIKNGINGYLAQNKDYVDLSKKIQLILGNVKERERLQQNIEKEILTLKTQDDFEEAIKCFIQNNL